MRQGSRAAPRLAVAVQPVPVSTAAPEVEKRRRLPQLPAARVRPPRADLSFLVLVLVLALGAPLIVKALGLDGPQVRDPHAVNLFGNPTGPGGGHPLGVDGAGRDVLSRILYGLRSLVLISLAASALATVLSGLLAGLGSLNSWLGWLCGLLVSAVRSYPALLLGLALGLSLGGVWRLIVPIALVQLLSMSSAGQLPAAFALALANAIGIDFGLTFLGLGPGGRTPQLGAMVAQAGSGIVAGVPAWWALLFPGLVVMLVLVAAQRLARALAPRLIPASPRRRLAGNPLVNQLGARVVQLIAAVTLAAVAFKALGGSDPDGAPALAGIGQDLGASGSLLLGGLVVWALATWLHLRLATRATRTPRADDDRLFQRIGRPLATTPAVLVTAAPVGWLAFLTIYAFSESVGKLAVLPGAGGYVGLTQHPGRWAQALVIPWLLLGLFAAARTIIALDPAAAEAADTGQQRVARAAGVPERVLARQRRRSLWAPLLARVEMTLPGFLGAALVIEVADRIPGAGARTVNAFRHGQAATVSDLTLFVAVAVIAAGSGLSTLRILADPRADR